MGKGAPDPPDYMALAKMGAESANQQLQLQTQANRPNQVTPWGSSNWQQDANGNWTQTQTLAPDQQKALGSQFATQAGLLGQAQELMPGVRRDMSQNPWQTGELTGWGQAPAGDPAARQRAEDAMYGRATSRLDPEQQRATEQKRNELYSMGLKEGNPVFDREMESLGRQQTDARQQALWGAVGAGQNEFANTFGQGLQGANYANTLRGMQLGEAGQRTGWNLSNIQRLIQGMGVGQQQFGSTPGSTAGQGVGVDYMGAGRQQFADQLAADAQKNSWAGNLTSMVGNVAGGAMKMSDERAKEVTGSGEPELEEFLRSAEGKRYNYDDEHRDHPLAGHGTYVTPIAQALRRSKLGKDLVHDTPDGMVVDYGQGLGTLAAAMSHLNKKIQKLEDK